MRQLRFFGLDLARPGSDRTVYPDAPGYAPPQTSKDAAGSMKPKAAALRQRILAELQVRGSFGATCDELEGAMGLAHQTASARLREMALKGLIVDSEMKRATRSGRWAIVWHAKEGWR
jgi:predicted transcriptional regulator